MASRNRKSKWALGLSLLGLIGCLDERRAGTTGVGNPPMATAAFTMKSSLPKPLLKSGSALGSAADTVFMVTDASGLVLRVREVAAGLEKVGIHLPDSLKCADLGENSCNENEIEIKGPFIMNLMTGKANPAMPPVKLPQGRYTIIDVKLADLSGLDTALDTAGILKGHSLVIKGEFDYRGRPDRAFEIRLRFNEDVGFTDAGGFRLAEPTPGKTPVVVLLLRIGKWLQGVDLKRCLDDGSLPLSAEGNLVLDNTKLCSGALSAIGQNVKSSGDLDSELDQGGPDQP